MADMPLMIAKLVLFLALGAFLGIIGSNVKKAQKADAEQYLTKIRTMGKLALLSALTIVVLAVLSFH